MLGRESGGVVDLEDGDQVVEIEELGLLWCASA
jgi:hypothetical protein